MVNKKSQWSGWFLFQWDKKCNGRQGSILIGVLWALMFLSTLAMAINAYVQPQIGLAERLKVRVKTFYLAKAGVRWAIVMIQLDETKEYDVLSDTWSNNEEGFKDVDLGEDGSFSVKYLVENVEGNSSGESEKFRYGLIDEERKLNINTAPYDVLKKFFEVVAQIGPQEAEEIADAIIDWRDEDQEPRESGAESAYYESLGYPCKNKLFETVEELLLIKGVTQTVFDLVRDEITVYTQGAINMNTASHLVLRGLGMEEGLVEKIDQFRRGSDGVAANEDDNIFKSAASITSALTSVVGLSSEEQDLFNKLMTDEILGVRSDNFMGNAFGTLKEGATAGNTHIVFVVGRNGKIKYWRE